MRKPGHRLNPSANADLRFDADRKVVMTDLDRHDLRAMTHETY